MNYTLLAALAAALLLPGCKRPSAEEYYGEAKMLEQETRQVVDTLRDRSRIPQMFAPVIAHYSKVFEEYPNSPLAETSMMRVAGMLNDDAGEPARAIAMYNRYLATYPQGAGAPRAMFLIGYLYNNSLHELDSASTAYQRFLDRFPQDELALSARFELNTLGKSPEELLPDTSAAEKESAKKTVAQRRRK